MTAGARAPTINTMGISPEQGDPDAAFDLNAQFEKMS
jgi:hypothetical protein